VLKFCPKCAKSSQEVEFLEDFCLEHAIENKIKFFKKNLELYICTKCNKIKIFNFSTSSSEWVEQDSKKFADYLFKKLKINLPIKIDDLKLNLSTGLVELKFKKQIFSFFIKIKLKKVLCNSCSISNSRSYQAIIQLRGEKQKIDFLYQKFQKLFLEYKIHQIKEKELKEGIDLFVSPKQNVVLLLSDKKIKFLRTSKLVGQRRDGKKIYLDTFLIKDY
jgi:NMD protein affecting ribosome stability and mRNA decay